MIYHTRLVARGVRHSLLDRRHAVHELPGQPAAGARERGPAGQGRRAHAVKLEGGRRSAAAVAAIVAPISR